MLFTWLVQGFYILLHHLIRGYTWRTILRAFHIRYERSKKFRRIRLKSCPVFVLFCTQTNLYDTKKKPNLKITPIITSNEIGLWGERDFHAMRITLFAIPITRKFQLTWIINACLFMKLKVKEESLHEPSFIDWPMTISSAVWRIQKFSFSRGKTLLQSP